MSVLTMVLVQSLFSGTYVEDRLPTIGEMEPAQMNRHEIYPWIGIQPIAVWTAWDHDLSLEDGWGYGADFTVTLDYGTSAFLGFRAGVIGWHTDTDLPAGLVNHGVDVRQYRIGIFGSFPFRFLEFSIGANVGGYRFRRRNESDTAGFFEFQAQLGFRPSPHVWLGIMGMQTLSASTFNSNSNHGLANYSIGPSVELRF
jgi:hypothetical protein